ncbi:hypothetical protein EK904_008876, partial [Melospiza melodia maxima]
NHHGADGEEYEVEYPAYGEGCLLQCDCSAECYREDSGHREYSLVCCHPQVEKTLEQLHLSSTQEEKEEEIRSPSEPGTHFPSSCDSASPIRKEKKKKTGKKHRRDR